MKKLIFMMIVILFSGMLMQGQAYMRITVDGKDTLVSVNSDEFLYSREAYNLGYTFNRSINKYKRMETAGKILTFSGIGVTTIGTVIYITSLRNVIYGREIYRNVDRSFIGIGTMVIGGGLAGVGIPLWVTGAKNKYKYRYDLSFSPNGIGLKMKF